MSKVLIYKATGFPPKGVCWARSNVLGGYLINSAKMISVDDPFDPNQQTIWQGEKRIISLSASNFVRRNYFGGEVCSKFSHVSNM